MAEESGRCGESNIKLAVYNDLISERRKGKQKNNETMKIKDADSLKKIQAFLKNADIIIKTRQ